MPTREHLVLNPLRACALVCTASLWLAGCGSSPEAPGAPVAKLDVSGSWTGSGSDSQGADSLFWILTQTDSTVSGFVATHPADPTNGSCASCHKNKLGTISGTLGGGGLVVTMVFPTGGNVPTPICSVTIDASTPTVTGKQIIANYSGSDSCEGPFINGAFTMVKR